MLLLLCGAWQTSFAQEKLKVSGIVKDAKSIPLPGVMVRVKDTPQSTQTDAQGTYSIELTKGQTLVFSLSGMQSQEVTPTASTLLEITLKREKLQQEKPLRVLL